MKEIHFLFLVCKPHLHGTISSNIYNAFIDPGILKLIKTTFDSNIF